MEAKKPTKFGSMTHVRKVSLQGRDKADLTELAQAQFTPFSRVGFTSIC